MKTTYIYFAFFNFREDVRVAEVVVGDAVLRTRLRVVPTSPPPSSSSTYPSTSPSPSFSLSLSNFPSCRVFAIFQSNSDVFG